LEASVGIYEMWQDWALGLPFLLVKMSFHVFKNMSESLKKVKLEVLCDGENIFLFSYFIL
jgi:hypothetical protein